MKRTYAILGSVCFLVLAPGMVAGLGPWLIGRWQLRPPFFGLAAFRLLGGALIAAGLPLVLDSFARFALQGMGTPAPLLPPRHLVVTGLYRYVRNPMYVGVAWLIFGQGLLLGEVPLLEYGLLVCLAFHLFVVAYEEPTLRRTFADEYTNFCAHVPRWLPRLRPWRGGTGPVASSR